MRGAKHGGQMDSGESRPSPSAQALVRVDVGLAARARVCHILEVIDEAGDQAAAQVTPASGEMRA